LTLIPLRDPISTISSWSVYNNDLPSISVQRNRLLSYTAWHRAVKKYAKSPHVMFVGFDSLGDSSDELLDCVREMNEGQELLLHMQNFPSEIREELKAPYVDVLNDPKLSRHLARATRVYENLMGEAVAINDVEIATAAAAAA
jgi:hypothetical protein